MASLRRILWGALFVAVFVILWTFLAANSARVNVSLVFAELREVRLWSLVLASFGSGAALVGALAALKLTQLSLLARRYRRAVQGLEAELHQLRNQPPPRDALAPGAGTSAVAATTSGAATAAPQKA